MQPRASVTYWMDATLHLGLQLNLQQNRRKNPTRYVNGTRQPSKQTIKDPCQQQLIRLNQTSAIEAPACLHAQLHTYPAKPPKRNLIDLGEVFGLLVPAAAAMAAGFVGLSVGHLRFNALFRCDATTAAAQYGKVTRGGRARQTQHPLTNKL